jgi:hypothetical protein
MATIRRYPVPADSFVPDRPLNDLLQAQLEHFRKVEHRLPRRVQPTLHPDMPPPSPKDAAASNHYIATMTNLIRERAQNPAAKPLLVTKAARPPRIMPAGLAIAASESHPQKSAAAKKKKKATPHKPKKSRKP